MLMSINKGYMLMLMKLFPCLQRLLSSADNLYKQFGPRSGRTNVGPGPDPKRLTLWVFLKEFFEKVYFEKNQQTTKKHGKLPSMQRVMWAGPYFVMLQLTSTWYQCTLAERWVRRQTLMCTSKSLVREATGANAIFRSQTVPGSLELDR